MGYPIVECEGWSRTTGVNEAVLVRLTAHVSRCREKSHFIRRYDPVYGLSHNTILKKRFCQVNNVINNNVAARFGQIQDAVGKTRLSPAGRVEGNSRFGSHIMHNFGHAPAFVGSRSAARYKIIDYLNISWQIVGGYTCCGSAQKIVGIGDDTNFLSGSL